MFRPTAFAATVSLLASSAFAADPSASSPTLPKLDAAQSEALTCSALFAIVASDQARGIDGAFAYPPLKVRGREYFVRFGAKTMDATGASRDAVKLLLETEVARLQKLATASADPDTLLAQSIGPCLIKLDAEVPQLPTPTLAQCTAIMRLAYEEVHAREGLTSKQAKDLLTLASVLEDRERKALIGEGMSTDQSDRKLSEEHDKMLKEALETGAGIEKYDLSTCYELAKPEPSKHY